MQSYLIKSLKARRKKTLGKAEKRPLAKLVPSRK